MDERIIVTLTTWSKRMGNIPTVLNTIFAQTLPPDLVVLNLAYDEVIPEEINCYLEKHSIEINRVEDTKVYKKLIPTLKKYPNDCIISVDDDWLYPKGMIEDFVNMHNLFPENPISGNREVVYGIQCHCGCASLTKARYFGDFLNQIDKDLIKNCPSDDLVYSYLCNLTGHPYVRTEECYFTNMEPYGANDGYSEALPEGIEKTYKYLINRFGILSNSLGLYVKDKYFAKLLDDITTKNVKFYYSLAERETEKRIYSTYAFRIGQAIIRPLRWLKPIINFCTQKRQSNQMQR